jgi:hypothetical protein
MKGREERTGDKSDNKLETQPFYALLFSPFSGSA